MKLMKVNAAAAIGALALMVLSGCGAKPPGCADAEVTATMRGLLLGESSPDPLVEAGRRATKIALTEVVSEGYQRDAQKQTCRAKLGLSLANGKQFEQLIQYSTQRTVDDKSKFVLAVEDVGGIQMMVRYAIDQTVSQQRWSGTWSGELACSASVRSTDAGPEAFTEQVAGEFRDGLLHVPLAGRYGINELVGRVNETERTFSLGNDVTSGKANPVRLTLSGTSTDGVLTGAGEIKDLFDGLSGLRLRSCQVRLSRGAPSRPLASEGATAQGWTGRYVGRGDGDVGLEVGTAKADGSYPVSLSTSTGQAGGGCGGAAVGSGQVVGTELHIKAIDGSLSCQAVAKRVGQTIELVEGEGCNAFHGAACGFSATLQRGR